MGKSLQSEVGEMLQKWVQYHLIPDHNEFWFSWDPSDPEDFRLLQKYEESDGSIAYLPNNLAKNLVSLWDFMNLLMKKDRPDGEHNKLYYLMDEQWTKFTAYDMRSALIDERQNPHMSPAATSPMSHLKTPTSPLPMRSPMHLELASFKKSIKREASAYSTLKDDRYFDKFQRDLFITAKSHDVSEILDPTFTPGSSPEEQELFEAKQVFMYKVFNETLLTDMGRAKVRKYLKTTDAQAVWKEYSEYMTTSSKGASEKRKITHYLTNTVLDSQFRGTTQQFVLHFNEQFRRLDDLTDISERMPDSIKMALLQIAVKDIPQLSIVETLDEYTSTTSGNGSFTHLNYSSYYNLLINACVRYDATKTSTPSKRRNVYAASGTQDFNTFEESHETHFSQDIDTPTDDFYQVHQTKHSRKPPTPLSGFQKDHSSEPSSAKKPSAPKKYDGPVYVPAEVYKLLSPEAVTALKKYNSEALNKMAKKRGIHVTDITDQVLSIAETNISEEQVETNQDEDEPEGEADPILDYINSQHHQEDDMNHALQAYNIMTSPFSDTTPQRSINSVHTHLLYHVAQAKQAQHGSLVDRGANGGLAGSDVRILSKSSRKCTVTGIDQHQINGLDIVQCAALVKTNHGYVNLIMNEYAYYGKGHTIHSSGQSEWNKNQVDDRSVKVGG